VKSTLKRILLLVRSIIVLPALLGGCAVKSREATPRPRAVAAPAAAAPVEGKRPTATQTAAKPATPQPPPPIAEPPPPTRPVRVIARFVPSSRGGIVYGRVEGQALPPNCVAVAHLATDQAYLQTDCVADVHEGRFAIPVVRGRAWRSIIVLVVRGEYLSQMALMTEPNAIGYLPDGRDILGRAVIERTRTTRGEFR